MESVDGEPVRHSMLSGAKFIAGLIVDDHGKTVLTEKQRGSSEAAGFLRPH